MNPLPDFARYSLCEDGISPYSLPGTSYGEYIATSYEHDEYGATSEDAHMKVAMTEKRMRKLDSIETCDEPISAKGYTVHNPEAKIFFVTYGFNAYLFQEYTRSHPEFGAIILERISPFPQQLVRFLQSRSEHINELRFVDGNMSGQL
jgi:2-oxoglutarate ferredoxin oxidoreductase subunit alpha